MCLDIRRKKNTTEINYKPKSSILLFGRAIWTMAAHLFANIQRLLFFLAMLHFLHEFIQPTIFNSTLLSLELVQADEFWDRKSIFFMPVLGVYYTLIMLFELKS